MQAVLGHQQEGGRQGGGRAENRRDSINDYFRNSTANLHQHDGAAALGARVSSMANRSQSDLMAGEHHS